jgi:cyclophilin family peptidyl-prolyl cis-trans isomerase
MTRLTEAPTENHQTKEQDRTMSRFATYLTVALVVASIMAVGTGCKGKTETTSPSTATAPSTVTTVPQPAPAAETKQPPKPEGGKPGKEPPKVTIETTKGDIEVNLYPKEAPKTVERFLSLVKEGYYNDMPWHRVVPGFVIQTGQGPEKPPIPDEVNEHKHQPGALAMAKPGPRTGDPTRLGEPNSATTQFYICMCQAEHLDTEFTVFGQVEKGMDVVTKITQEDKIRRIKPVEDAP